MKENDKKDFIQWILGENVLENSEGDCVRQFWAFSILVLTSCVLYFKMYFSCRCSINRYYVLTLYNIILRIARNFLETRENVKILTHLVYHTNLDWFSWEWSKKKIFFLNKKIQNGRFFKIAIFQNRQFSKFFRENFTNCSFG